MLAHLTFEIAPVVDFNLDVDGLIRAGVQYSGANLFFFSSYLIEVIHF